MPSTGVGAAHNDVEPGEAAGVEPAEAAGVEVARAEVGKAADAAGAAGVEPAEAAGVEPAEAAGVEPAEAAGVEVAEAAGVEPAEEVPEVEAAGGAVGGVEVDEVAGAEVAGEGAAGGEAAFAGRRVSGDLRTIGSMVSATMSDIASSASSHPEVWTCRSVAGPAPVTILSLPRVVRGPTSTRTWKERPPSPRAAGRARRVRARILAQKSPRLPHLAPSYVR